MRKSLSNLPPVLSGNVSTDVSGSFFTLPVTQRPLSNAFLISPFKKACDAGHEEVNEINIAVKAFGISCILPNIWQLFLIPNWTSERFIYLFIHCFYLKKCTFFFICNSVRQLIYISLQWHTCTYIFSSSDLAEICTATRKRWCDLFFEILHFFIPLGRAISAVAGLETQFPMELKEKRLTLKLPRFGISFSV